MTRLRWTTVLFLVGGISAILLHFISKVEGFPQEVMYVFLPADYVWDELKKEAGGGILGKIIGNVAVFGLLAGAQGALLGLLLDFRTAGQRATLNLRVKRLRRSTDTMDLAFKRRVLEILTKYDPAGLIKLGSDNDAYTPQADIILRKITKLGSARKLRKFCQQSFHREFGGRVAGKFKKYNSLSEQIWLAYRRQLSPTGQAPPTSEGL